MSLDSGVTLHLSPGQCTYFDEPINIEVIGLLPECSVVLRSKLIDCKGVLFEASGFYCSDKNGNIDLDRCPSLGGSYSGTDAMGLLTWMRPLVPHKKLMKKDVSTPLTVEIEVECNGLVLAKETIQRRFLSDDLQKVPLEGGSIRGSLFLPPGKSRPTTSCSYVMPLDGVEVVSVSKGIVLT